MDHPTMHICKNTQSFIFDRLTIIYPYQYLKKKQRSILKKTIRTSLLSSQFIWIYYFFTKSTNF